MGKESPQHGVWERKKSLPERLLGPRVLRGDPGVPPEQEGTGKAPGRRLSAWGILQTTLLSSRGHTPRVWAVASLGRGVGEGEGDFLPGREEYFIADIV